MRLFIVIVCSLLLTACSTPSIDGNQYVDSAPDFRIERFFDGNVRAWGIVQDRTGNVTQRFEADIVGTFENDKLTLDETFSYGFGDGLKKRVWTITRNDNDTYTGSADDIVGPAEGTSYGNAMAWGYQMDLPVGDDTYRVTFEDWMWAFDDETIINRAYIKKFGIVFAEVTIFMRKSPSA